MPSNYKSSITLLRLSTISNPHNAAPPPLLRRQFTLETAPRSKTKSSDSPNYDFEPASHPTPQMALDFDRARITKRLTPDGGSGSSIRACNVDGFNCAMKEYSLGRNRVTNQVNRVLTEILFLRSLSHPNIVRYLHHIRSPTSVRVFMTRYEMSLRKEIRTRADAVEEGEADPFTIKETLGLLIDIAKGLDYLHKLNIMHRDLKSENIFLEFNESGGWTAVIGDFDTAKRLTKSNLHAQTIVGTSNYIAPEIMNGILTPKSPSPRGAPSLSSLEPSHSSHSPAGSPTSSSSSSLSKSPRCQYSFKADIWSFAMVGCEIVTLQLPYESLGTYEAISWIAKGKRPPIPSSSNGLPFADDIDKFKGVINLIDDCAMLDPDCRLSAEEVCVRIGKLLRLNLE
jgi:serine/threonine protein kinase